MAEREGLPQSITDIQQKVHEDAEATGIAESLLIEGIEVDAEVVRQRFKPTEPKNPQPTQPDEGSTSPTRTEL